MMRARLPLMLYALGTLPLIFESSKQRRYKTTDSLKAFDASHLGFNSE
jgi:hypothetical protein